MMSMRKYRTGFSHIRKKLKETTFLPIIIIIFALKLTTMLERLK